MSIRIKKAKILLKLSGETIGCQVTWEFLLTARESKSNILYLCLRVWWERELFCCSCTYLCTVVFSPNSFSFWCVPISSISYISSSKNLWCRIPLTLSTAHSSWSPTCALICMLLWRKMPGCRNASRSWRRNATSYVVSWTVSSSAWGVQRVRKHASQSRCLGSTARK